MKCKLLHLMKIILQQILYRNLYQLLILTSFTATYCVQCDGKPPHVVFEGGQAEHLGGACLAEGEARAPLLDFKEKKQYIHLTTEAYYAIFFTLGKAFQIKFYTRIYNGNFCWRLKLQRLVSVSTSTDRQIQSQKGFWG